MSLERFARAANAAACDTLSQLGDGLVNLGAWTMWTPKVGVTALTLGAASNLAYQYSCGVLDVGASSPDDGARGCQELSSGSADLGVYRSDGSLATILKRDITGYTVSEEFLSPTLGVLVREFFFQTVIGGPYGNEMTYGLGEGDYVEMILDAEAVCGKDVVPLPSLPPVVQPYQYTDPETNCELTLNFEGFVQESEGGNVQPVYLIENSSSSVLRADGGRIGGCIIKPTIYYPGANGPGGGGGGNGIPLPPGDLPLPGPAGEPWWADLLQAALGGAAALAADKLLDALVESSYPGAIYRMVSVCEKDESGEPISEAVEVPIPELQAPDAQLARLDAIVELLQASKNFKQPVCNDRPKLEGNWRTISFRSTESSPYGKSCIRKRFRYRSLSGIGLGELVDHWKDFTWTTGPVCVTHKGYSWGTPQVWAASIDEGKRVIQHAAREAGFDAFEIGEWVISSSSSARYGVSLPMKVDTTGGYYWITERDGSDGRPIVALTPHP